jgi:hypothetical protein
MYKIVYNMHDYEFKAHSPTLLSHSKNEKRKIKKKENECKSNEIVSRIIVW